MFGQGGRTWLSLTLFFCLVCAPSWGWAGQAGASPFSDFPAGRPLLSWASAQTPLEAQMFGEKPFPAKVAPVWPPISLPSLIPPEGGAGSYRLPGNVELRISFLYHSEQTAYTPERPIHSHLLFKYSMDYGLLPNLQVGFSGFFYYPQAEDLFFQRRLGHKAMAWGPGVRYDLGKWTFTFRTQLGPGTRDGSDLQNWFRVWYAF